jgi:alkanesulfonate monooxygenase SsuD/methylene tetrahydromethanopterin reductase-like flavin-dependent oxidoreductase (luciferase family)
MLEQLGVALSPSSAELSPTFVRDLVAAVVDSGFDALWALDNPLADQAEPLTFLTSAVALSETLRVGSAAIVAPVRDPILLAKQVATLDRLTGGGRVTLGLTIGRRPDEYETIGRDFRHRGRLLDDVVTVVRACWAGEPIDVDGMERTWTSRAAVGVPPATPGGPPILLGGVAEPALARAVRLGDGYLGSATGGPRRAIEALARVVDLCAAAHRPRDAFRAVTNVFVLVAPTRANALEHATTVFTARHGGQPPPWDPADVVVGGEPRAIADGIAELAAAGYEGITMVPVIGSIEQVVALRTAVAMTREAVPAAASVH